MAASQMGLGLRSRQLGPRLPTSSSQGGLHGPAQTQPGAAFRDSGRSLSPFRNSSVASQTLRAGAGNFNSKDYGLPMEP